MNSLIASISLFTTIVSSAPAPAQTSIETSSTKSHFNLGVSSNLNTLDFSGQNLGNLAQIANQKIQGLSNLATQKAAAGTLTQAVAAAPQKFSLLNHVQALAVQQPASSFPDSGRKQAAQESETKQSMVDSLYSYAQQFVAGLFNHKPIIDMTQEKDKYGNDGDKYRNIGTAVVNSFEGLSNFLNSAVEKPFTIMRQVAQKATTALNNYGGKLVGLQ